MHLVFFFLFKSEFLHFILVCFVFFSTELYDQMGLKRQYTEKPQLLYQNLSIKLYLILQLGQYKHFW